MVHPTGGKVNKRQSHLVPGFVRRLSTVPLFLVAATVACSSRPASASFEWTIPPASPRWPQPPDTARIAWLGQLAGPADIGVRRSVFRRVADFVSGAKPQRIAQPYGIAVDGADRVIVADQGARGVHRFDPVGRKYDFISHVGRTRLETPVGVAADSLGRIWLTDSRLALVAGLDPSGRERCRAGRGFVRPTGIAFDRRRKRLYVVDSHAHELVVLDADCRSVTTIGVRGVGTGQFNFPTNVAVGADGSVYVTDAMNFRVQVFSPAGEFRTAFGRNGDQAGDLARPKGLAADASGRIFVAEGLFDAVNIFDADGRHLLTFGGAGHGPGEFWLATGMAIDRHGRVYVADSFNGRVQVFAPLPASP